MIASPLLVRTGTSAMTKHCHGPSRTPPLPKQPTCVFMGWLGGTETRRFREFMRCWVNTAGRKWTRRKAEKLFWNCSSRLQKARMAFWDNCLHSSDHLREQVADNLENRDECKQGRGIKLVITYREVKKKETGNLLPAWQPREEAKKIMNCYKTNIATGHMVLSIKTQLLKMVWSSSLYTTAVTAGNGWSHLQPAQAF